MADTEFILNVHSHQNELEEHASAATGWSTGQSYVIIAFVRNTNDHGHVLLAPGFSAEGTEAAGSLATDFSRLITTSQKCGHVVFRFSEAF